MSQKFNVNVAKSNKPVNYSNNDVDFATQWDSLRVFEKKNSSLLKEPFVLLDGPPYANGDAHMGHVLNKLLKDLVVKSRWQLGHPVKFTPGWDCHGLPLELAVEKSKGKLDESSLKKGCKSLALKSVVKQRKRFKKLGVLAEWDSPYLTLSNSLVNSSWDTVRDLVSKDLLSFKKYPVNYCPACASSLAEAELEEVVLPKSSLYFKMKVAANTFVVVWTTTPWTLPMNQAVCLNPDFEYSMLSNGVETLVCQLDATLSNKLSPDSGYSLVKTLTGSEVLALFPSAESPLTKKQVPVTGASFVEQGKTGFVHLVAAHGVEDFEVCATLGLNPESYLDSNGVFNQDLPSNLNELQGLKYTKTYEVVETYLKKDNLLLSHTQSSEPQSACWRHKCGVYYNATPQVFLELDHPSFNLKEKVSALLDSSNLREDEATMLKAMMLKRNNWCLSRQRKWGTPLNLVVNTLTGALDKEYSLKYLTASMEGNTAKVQSELNSNSNLTVFKDVLDVWFDSGNLANGLNPNSTANLVVEGKDQYRGWFQSLLWLSAARFEKMPYSQVLCHGFVLDENRNKLSKSNQKASNKRMLDDLQDKYGADSLRLWVAAQEPGLDPVFSEKRLEEVKAYYSRFRLSLRFMTSNCYEYEKENHESLFNTLKDSPLFDVHKYVLNELSSLKTTQNTLYEKLEFKKALEETYKVFDRLLSNFYFDYLKTSLYLLNKKSSERMLHLCGLHEVLCASFDLLKVFVPFVCEEFYQDYFGKENDSVLLQSYERPNYELTFDWSNLSALRKEVLGAVEPLQKNKEVKSRTEVWVSLSLPSKLLNQLTDMQNKGYRLTDLFSCSKVSLLESDSVSLNLKVMSNNELFEKCPRCWNYSEKTTFVHALCPFCSKED